MLQHICVSHMRQLLSPIDHGGMVNADENDDVMIMHETTLYDSGNITSPHAEYK